MKSVCGIYKITSPSGKIYIGSSANMPKRINEHKGYFERGDHYNGKLRSAAKKYGADAMVFSVMVICERRILRDIEQRAIDAYKPEYNIEQTVGKVLHDFWTDAEWRKRNSERCSRQNRERWADQEYRAKKTNQAAVMQTDEARKKSIKNRKKFFDENSPRAQQLRQIAGDRFRELHKDPTFRDAHYKKISDVAKERFLDPNEKIKIAEVFRRNNSRPLYCITTGEYFRSRAEAASAMGISLSLLQRQVRGDFTRSGYEWRELHESEYGIFGIDKVRTDKPKFVYRGGATKKPVLCIELNVAFKGLTQASAAFGNEDGSILSNAISRKTKAFGYSWRFLNESDLPVSFDDYGFGELAHLRKDSRKRAVVCVETNDIYECVEEAAVALVGNPVKKHAIFDCLRGRKPQALGYTWKYADQDQDI